MDGAEKVATFLLALDPQIAAQLLSRFERQEMSEIVHRMLAMEYVGDEQVRAVLSEFGQLIESETQAVAEPKAKAKTILEQALEGEEVETFLGEHDVAATQGNPFATLEKLEPEQLAGLLAQEHSQTVALVLSRLEPRKAGQVLSNLPTEVAVEAVRRLAAGGQEAPAAVLESVGRVLGQRARAVAQGGGAGSAEARFSLVARLLSAAKRATREAALGAVREHDPETGEAVRNLMFLFDDLPKLRSEDLRKVISALDTQTIALALKTASEEVKKAIFEAVSSRAGETIREEQELLGPKPLSEVEAAQQSIVETVARLQEEGEITLAQGAEEEEMV